MKRPLPKVSIRIGPYACELLCVLFECQPFYIFEMNTRDKRTVKKLGHRGWAFVEKSGLVALTDAGKAAGRICSSAYAALAPKPKPEGGE